MVLSFFGERKKRPYLSVKDLIVRKEVVSEDRRVVACHASPKNYKPGLENFDTDRFRILKVFQVPQRFSDS